MEKIIVLTGAGVSAESGVKTFRDAGGLWEGHDVRKVASIDGWLADPTLVLEFYNRRRRQLKDVEPNAAHRALVELEERFDVAVVTQNVDDLHERAGSSRVLHLHGELRKARSTKDESLVYDWEEDLHLGDTCELGGQLRPHVVWFGETVPMMGEAAHLVSQADRVLIIGTSMQVYPAAGLVGFAPDHAPIHYVDPHPAIHFELSRRDRLEVIAERAGTGVSKLVRRLLEGSQDGGFS